MRTHLTGVLGFVSVATVVLAACGGGVDGLPMDALGSVKAERALAMVDRAPAREAQRHSALSTPSAPNAEVLAPAFTVGGSISGMTGSQDLVLTNRQFQTLVLQADGQFRFGQFEAGTPYRIEVQEQPKGKTCRVINGEGTMGGAHIESVQVVCTRRA